MSYQYSNGLGIFNHPHPSLGEVRPVSYHLQYDNSGQLNQLNPSLNKHIPNSNPMNEHFVQINAPVSIPRYPVQAPRVASYQMNVTSLPQVPSSAGMLSMAQDDINSLYQQQHLQQPDPQQQYQQQFAQQQLLIQQQQQQLQQQQQQLQQLQLQQQQLQKSQLEQQNQQLQQQRLQLEQQNKKLQEEFIKQTQQLATPIAQPSVSMQQPSAQPQQQSVLPQQPSVSMQQPSVPIQPQDVPAQQQSVLTQQQSMPAQIRHAKMLQDSPVDHSLVSTPSVPQLVRSYEVEPCVNTLEDHETRSTLSSSSVHSFVSSPLVMGPNLVSSLFLSPPYVTPAPAFSPDSSYSQLQFNPTTPSTNKFSIPTPQTEPIYQNSKFHPSESAIDDLVEIGAPKVSRFSTESLTPEDIYFSEPTPQTKLEDILNDNSLSDYCSPSKTESRKESKETKDPKELVKKADPTSKKIIKQKSTSNLLASSSKKKKQKPQKPFSLEECSRSFQTLNTINIIQENFSKKKVLKSKSMNNLKRPDANKKTAFGKYALNA